MQTISGTRPTWRSVQTMLSTSQQEVLWIKQPGEGNIGVDRGGVKFTYLQKLMDRGSSPYFATFQYPESLLYLIRDDSFM